MILAPHFYTLMVLVLLLGLMLTTKIPQYLLALLAGLALIAGKVITFKVFYQSFSNPILILFAGMFVIGEAMFRTGLAEEIGKWAIKLAGKSERQLLWLVMLSASVISTLASNTGTTAALLPIVLSITAVTYFSRAKVLMPLAFATGFGGFSTLIGTPPNMIVSEYLALHHFKPFTFFEFAWVGIPLALAGMLYMDWARRWLKDRGPELLAGDPSKVVSASLTKKWVCGIILLVVLGVMIAGNQFVPLEIIALLGAILCVVTGCLSSDEAIKSIEWDMLLLFGGMFCLGFAMESSGAAALLSQKIFSLLGSQAPGYSLVALVMVVTMLLGTFLSNTGCAVMMAPLGFSLAEKFHANPQPLLMAIAVAASCNFMSPFGTPPNLLVMKPGGYLFSDYLKVGIGLSVVCLLLGVLIVPWVWPVYP